ncbi:MAG: flagellar biosynthetic protein FliR [Deltaproteobacteria bacterium]|nr:flagellar biosynthetic protein FliR [Deltaproteobacteria bacterium]
MNDFIIQTSLVAARLSGIAALPLFSPASSPISLRFAVLSVFCIYISWIIPPLTLSSEVLVGAFISELLLGIMIYVIVSIFFSTLSSGFNLFEKNVSSGSTNDPVTGGSYSPLSSAASLLTAVIFFVSGIHLQFIEVIVHSFKTLPPGNLYSFSSFSTGVSGMIKAMSLSFSISVFISMTAFALLVLATSAMGIIGRFSQGLQTHFLSMPLRSIMVSVGGILIFLSSLIILGEIFSLMLGFMKIILMA